MSVVSVNEARLAREGSEDSKQTSWVRVFDVTTDDIDTDVVDILEDSNVPDIGDTHPSASYMVCTRRTVKTYEDDFHWKVDCEYGRNSGAHGPLPTDEEPKIDFSSATHEIVAEKAYDAADAQGAPSIPIENSAKDPFDPPLMDDKRNMLIVINRNEPLTQFDAETYISFENTLNSVAVKIAGITIAQYEGLIRAIKGSKRWDKEGDAYYEVTYEIEVDRETFVLEVVDRGFYELVGTEKVPILDTEGNLVQEPAKLDGLGRKADPTYAPPATLFFRTKFAKDFNDLDLPEEE